jgi:hypothetical protein
MVHELHPAVPGADDAYADAIVRAQNAGRASGQGSGQAVGDFTYEISARIHLFSV